MTKRVQRVRAAVAAVLALAVLSVGLGVPAIADELDDRRARTAAQQAAVDAAMEELAAELEHTDAALVQAYAELQGIEARLPAAQAELVAAEELVVELQREAQIIADRLEAARTEESSITGQIEADTGRAEEIKVAVGQMAREAYKGDMTAASLAVVLDAKTTDEFVEESAMADTALRTQTQALRDLDQINGVNRNRQARLTAVREQVTALKAEADAKVVQAEEARAEAEARKLELERLRAEQATKTAEIESQREAQLAKQQEFASQQAQLADDLASIVAAQEAERRRREAAAAAARAAAAAAGRAAPAASDYGDLTGSRPFNNPTSITPIYKTSDYGMRFHPVLSYWRMHAGTDLRTYCGTPIYAGAAGSVQWARMRGGFGNQVLINHGFWNDTSLMSSYNHLSSFAVSSGQSVTQGQLIGYSGNTGTSSACHLHFEVYVNGNTVDPWPLINR